MHTDAQLLALQQAFAAMEAATSIDEWVVADLAYHQSILQATGNPLLISLGGIVASALESLLTVNRAAGGQFNDGLLMHGKVLAAIERALVPTMRSCGCGHCWPTPLPAGARPPKSLHIQVSRGCRAKRKGGICPRVCSDLIIIQINR
ncbi:FadR/GntR family transcriptional regulator [Comamonas sp. JC664]|uniref:FadR/GntR family transcriptional regulator n=1 Tax=Comamonas sp. JC664 TaxID=2801917 RepID=UPI0036141C88